MRRHVSGALGALLCFIGLNLRGDCVSQQLTPAALSSAPIAIASADLNSDGVRDFVVTYVTGMEVLIRTKLDGGPLISARQAYNLSGPATSFVLADIDHDNIADVIVATQNPPVVYFFVTHPNGSLTFRGATATNMVKPAQLAVGDFDGDGQADIAVADPDAAVVHIIWRPNIDGSLALVEDFTAGAQPAGVAAARLNNDASDDLIIANRGDGNISVRLAGTTPRTFDPAVNYPTGEQPTFVLTTDLNGDGHQDAIVVNQRDAFSTGSVSMLVASTASPGTLLAATSVSVPGHPSSPALGDFDNDGREDLALTHTAVNLVSYLINVGNGAVDAPYTFDVTSPVAVAGGKADFVGARAAFNVAQSGPNQVAAYWAPDCPPTLTSLSPQLVLSDAQTPITMTGTHLWPGQTIAAVFTPAGQEFDRNATCASTRQCTFLAPSFQPLDGPGSYKVFAKTPRGTSNEVDYDYVFCGNGTVVSMQSASLIVSEGAPYAAVVVGTDHGHCDTSVSYSTSSGTAVAGSDFTTTTGTLTFQKDSYDTQTIYVPILNDGIQELDETFQVTLSNPDQLTLIGSPSVTTITIRDDDGPTVALSVNTPTVAEGASATVTATLSRTSPFATTVGLTFAGTASFTSDYTANQTIVVPAGSLTGTTTINAIADNIDEFDETVIVTMSSANNGAVVGAPSQVSTTILDGDAPPTVTLDPLTPQIAEGGGTATVTARLSRKSDRGVVVNLGYSGTATYGVDYTAPTSIVVPNGSLTASVTIISIQDAILEDYETVIVDITGVTEGTESGTQQVSTLIIDDDTPPVINTISPSSGPGIGGTKVTITGSRLTLVQIYFGDTLSVDAHCTDTLCTAYSPAGFGTVNVRGVLPGVSSAEIPADEFTYAAPTGPQCARFVTLPYMPVNDVAFLAAGKFNADAYSDLVMLEGGTVNVYLTNGPASFNAPVSYAAGSSPMAIVATDVNGDGHPDLVVANYASNNVSVLLASGTAGAFAPAVNYPTLTHPTHLAVGDVNGDGRPDIVVASQETTGIQVLRASGALGTFAAATSFPAATSFSVAIGDFNGDSFADIAFTSGNKLLVLPGLATAGTFGAAVLVYTDPDVNASLYSLHTADFNGDGRPDLVMTGIRTSGLLFLATGTGSFFSAPFVFGGNTAYATATADFNGDGLMDVAVSNNGQSSTSAFLGSGLGTVRLEATLPNDDVSVYDVTVGDFNGDGRPDLATATLNTVQLFLNTTSPGSLSFSSPAFSAAEADGHATITVNRAGGSDCIAAVNFSTTPGTAVAGQDYTAVAGLLTFADGQTSRTFDVPLTADGIDEPDETFNTSITAFAAAPLIAPSSAVVTIVDSDPTPSVTLTGGGAIQEGGTATITATLSNKSSSPITVPLTYSGTATRGDDYTAADSIVVPAGDLQASMSLISVNDGVAEGNETVIIDDGTQQVSVVIADPLNVPASFVATATSPTTVSLCWNAVSDATGYEVWRTSSIHVDYALALTTNATCVDDPAVLTADTAYLYKVRATRSVPASIGDFSAVDLATTVVFGNGNAILASDFVELQRAIKAMRIAGDTAPYSFARDPITAGMLINQQDMIDLRMAMDGARNALLLPPASYTDTGLPAPTAVRKEHIQELRDAAK